MGDKVKTKSGEAVKLSKTKLESQPGSAVNGRVARSADTSSDQKAGESAGASAQRTSDYEKGKTAGQTAPIDSNSAGTDAAPAVVGAVGRHMAPPLPIDNEPNTEAAGEVLADSNSASPQVVASSNPWFSWNSWWSLLWIAFKTAVIVVVMCSAAVFGAVVGVTVYRTYFAVPDEIEVPAIQGKDFAVANEMLKNMGLRLRIEEGRHTAKFPDRIIISQDPPKGRVVRKNREVLAVVSLGPEQFKVPDLKGLSLREVKKSLNNNKLNLGKVTYVPKSTNRPDEVLDQKPAAGTLALKGAKINITINKGLGMAKVSVPDCTGRNLTRVMPMLSKVGLNLGKIIWSVSDKASGEILSQSPPGGAAVMSDSEITLEVSAGSASSNVLVHHKLEIFLPGGSEPSEVRVVVLSPEGEEEVYRASHVVNDIVKLWVTGRPGSEAEVYINNKLFMRDKL
ncbi:MAG: PASTA domain-containing protein [Candidatus Bruticola sp.]